MVNKTAMPGEAERLVMLGDALWAAGLSREALAAYEDALRLEPANAAALRGGIVSLMDAGLMEEASALAEGATRKNPGDASLWRLLGTAALAAGDGELAVKAFEACQEAEGVNTGSLLRLAEAAYFALDAARARRFAALALEREPGSKEALVWQRKLAPLDDRFMLLSQAGADHCRQGRLKQGTAVFKQALSLGDSASLRLNLARGLLMLGEVEEAAGHFEAAVKKEPADPDAAIGLGNAYYLMGKTSLAEEEYRRALAMQPEKPEALLGLARVSLKTGSAAAARQYAARALDDTNPEAWLVMAQVLSAQGDSAGARLAADHGIALDATFAPAWDIGAGVLEKQGLSALAGAYRRKARRLAGAPEGENKEPPLTDVPEAETGPAGLEGRDNPEDILAGYRDRAFILGELGLARRALGYVGLIEQRYPEHVSGKLMVHKGYLLLAEGRKQEARGCFESALAGDGGSEAARLGLIASGGLKAEEAGTGERRPAPESLFCGSCGSRLKAGARFCGRCGAVLE